MQRTTRTLRIPFYLSLLALAACGGGGGGGGNGGGSDGASASTATGVFKDGNVEGVEYRSGEQSGITDADGTFVYEVGETVTFSLGGVTIGTVEGREVVTPLEMVDGASVSDDAILNRVRFLLLLDSDGDPDNGIQVSDGVRSMAEGWGNIDFTTNDLAAELTDIANDVASVDGDGTIPPAADAENHFTGTVRCVASGLFVGTYDGDSNGRLALRIDVDTGNVFGGGYSVSNDSIIGLSSTSALTLDQQRAFVSGLTSGGGSFSGELGSLDSLTGILAIGPDTDGTFEAARVAGDLDTTFRYSALFEGDEDGAYAFNIDDDGNVAGIAYYPKRDVTAAITGRLVGTTLSATDTDGASISGPLNTSVGTVSGAWSNSDRGTSGTFGGDGCRLN